MALGIKYQLDWEDELEITWRVDILLEGYVAAVIPMKQGGTPLVIEMRDIDDPFTPICHSEAIVTLMSESSGQYDEFKTADVFDYTVQITRSGTLFWQGTLITEPFTEEFDSTPYEVELRFSDGLSELQYERFDVAGVLQAGFTTAIDIMVKCFNKLPFTRNIREIVNLFEDSMNDADTEGLFEQLTIFEAAYWENDKSNDVVKGIPCLDVLTFIIYALKSRLIVSEDKYYIIGIREMKTVGVVKFVDYDDTGTVTGNGTVALTKSVTGKNVTLPTKLAHLAGASIDINKQFQEVEFRYSSRNIVSLNNNILINGDFNSGYELENGSPVPLHYTRSAAVNTVLGVTPSALHVEPVFIPIEFDESGEGTDETNANVLVMTDALLLNTKIGTNPVTAELVDTPATIDYLLAIEESVPAQLTRETYSLKPESPADNTITYKNLLHDTADNLEIRIRGYFDYTYADPTFPNSAVPLMFNKWTIKLGNNFYNTKNQLWSTDVNSRVWDRQMGDYWNDEWVDQILGIRRHHFDQVIVLGNFITTSVSDLEVTWFIPENTRGPVSNAPDQISKVDIVFEHMNINYVSADSTEFSFQKVLGETGSTSLRTRRYISEVRHGDGPSNFSVMSFRLNTNLATALWSTRGGAEALPLYKFDINDVFENLGVYRLIFNGDLYGLLELHNLIDTIEGKKFMIKGMRFSVKENKYELKLHEVGANAPVVTFNPQVALSGLLTTGPTEDTNPDIISQNQPGFEIISQNNTDSNTESQSYTQTTNIISNNDSDETANDYPVG